jgi:hypothetical protein
MNCGDGFKPTMWCANSFWHHCLPFQGDVPGFRLENPGRCPGGPAGEIICPTAGQSNAVVPLGSLRTKKARSMPTVAAKSRSSGHPCGKWRPISRFELNRTTLASTQSVLTGLSIRIDSGAARSMGFSASTSAPFRLMLINVAPTLRRPSGTSNWMLDRFFTTSQRVEALRSSGSCVIGHPRSGKCWRLKSNIHTLI